MPTLLCFIDRLTIIIGKRIKDQGNGPIPSKQIGELGAERRLPRAVQARNKDNYRFHVVRIPTFTIALRRLCAHARASQARGG